jgi:hypothetical protein
MRAAAEFRNARRRLHATERVRLDERTHLPQLVLPLVAGALLDADSIESLADEWAPR